MSLLVHKWEQHRGRGHSKTSRRGEGEGKYFSWVWGFVLECLGFQSIERQRESERDGIFLHGFTGQGGAGAWLFWDLVEALS